MDANFQSQNQLHHGPGHELDTEEVAVQRTHFTQAQSAFVMNLPPAVGRTTEPADGNDTAKPEHTMPTYHNSHMNSSLHHQGGTQQCFDGDSVSTSVVSQRTTETGTVNTADETIHRGSVSKKPSPADDPGPKPQPISRKKPNRVIFVDEHNRSSAVTVASSEFSAASREEMISKERIFHVSSASNWDTEGKSRFHQQQVSENSNEDNNSPSKHASLAFPSPPIQDDMEAVTPRNSNSREDINKMLQALSLDVEKQQMQQGKDQKQGNEESSQALDEKPKRRSHKYKRKLILLTTAFLITLVVIGIIVGVLVGNKSKNDGDNLSQTAKNNAASKPTGDFEPWEGAIGETQQYTMFPSDVIDANDGSLAATTDYNDADTAPTFNETNRRS